jgi:energy-coupling factor transport system ATP-binding protein
VALLSNFLEIAMENPVFHKLDFFSNKGIVLVKGGNFSGRSTLLRKCIRASNAVKKGQALCVGAEIGDYRSGIAPTVRAELRLCSGHEFRDMKTTVLAKNLGLLELLDQNPGTLSGGQQAALVVVNLLNKASEFIAIDCALEQIDPPRKSIILDWMEQNISGQTSAVITDNRCNEYSCAIESCNVGDFIDLPKDNDYKIGGIESGHDRNPLLGKPEAIEIRDLTFGYDKHQPVLDKTSISLIPGNVYHLLGENGAGKSTFAKLLTGVLCAQSGTFSFGGIPQNPWNSPGKKVTYHLQDADDQLQCGGKSPSVLGEIQEGLRMLDVDRSTMEAIASDIVHTFGLENIVDLHPFDLPFSVRKRIALAACLAPGKPWIVLDEPTLGQDDQSMRAIAEIVRVRANAGVGFIVISHSMLFHDIIGGEKLIIENNKIASFQD